jgi:hypothetical protein
VQLGNQHLPLYSQESNSEFSKLQSLLEAKEWLLPIEKQSLCWATTGSICVVGTSARWDVDAIEQWQISIDSAVRELAESRRVSKQ